VPLLRNFARRVLNSAPFDLVLELPFPPPRFQERSEQSNPHQLSKIFVAVLQQADGAAVPAETDWYRRDEHRESQFGYGPGIERTELNPWLQNSRYSEQ